MSHSTPTEPIPLSADQLRPLRTRAQRLGPDPWREGDVAQIVSHLCGVQAQEAPAAALAIRARGNNLVADDIERERVEERSVVRTWAMRGTLHLVATGDLGWLLALLGPRFAAADRRRREELGLDDAASERGVRVIRDALKEHGPLTRAQIAEHLAAHELPSTGQAPAHLIALAALEGVICLGPDSGSKPTYVLLSDWVETGTGPKGEQALVELARRYLSAYGPASAEDFGTWSGVPLSEVRAAWKQLSDELFDVQIISARGATDARVQMLRTQAGWLDDLPGRSPVVRLVPGYDPYLLGYRNRDLAVAPEHARRIHPGGGVLNPTIVVDGLAVGTWRTKKSRGSIEVIIEPFGRLPGEVTGGLEAEVADIGRFLGVPTSWSKRS